MNRDKVWNRREFARALARAGAAGLAGLWPVAVAAEPSPETRRLRVTRSPGLCQAPQYVAEELLRAEGFAELQYVNVGRTVDERLNALASGEADIMATFVSSILSHLDRGAPVTVLAGLHGGCFEVFVNHRVRAIRDLKGKIIAISYLGSPQHLFLASILAHIGVDARREVTWVTHPFAESSRLLAEGKIDAFLGFPPEPQELRANKIGQTLVNSTVDRPWSQYFCCMLVANNEFTRRHPVAMKRAIRALLKGADLCALEPNRAASLLIERGYAKHYDYARQTMVEIPYRRWRDYDAEDSLRFYALRLSEAGMIKSSPQKLIAQGTNWRFINDVKRELKG